MPKKSQTLEDFLDDYDADRTRTTFVDVERSGDAPSPLIVVRHGRFTALLNPLGLGDHLCVDVHPFVDDHDATAGAFGFGSSCAGRAGRVAFDADHTVARSHGWPAAEQVAVLVGEQTEVGA